LLCPAVVCGETTTVAVATTVTVAACAITPVVACTSFDVNLAGVAVVLQLLPWLLLRPAVVVVATTVAV
jgi:hypothetical protein